MPGRDGDGETLVTKHSLGNCRASELLAKSDQLPNFLGQCHMEHMLRFSVFYVKCFVGPISCAKSMFLSYLPHFGDLACSHCFKSKGLSC
jgi:hypothetical protein